MTVLDRTEHDRLMDAARANLAVASEKSSAAHAAAANNAQRLGVDPFFVRDDGLDVKLASVKDNPRAELTSLYASDKQFAGITQGDHDNLTRVVDDARNLLGYGFRDQSGDPVRLTAKQLAGMLRTQAEQDAQPLDLDNLSTVQRLGFWESFHRGQNAQVRKGLLLSKELNGSDLTPDERAELDKINREYPDNVEFPNEGIKGLLFEVFSSAAFFKEGFRSPLDDSFLTGIGSIITAGGVSAGAGALLSSPGGPPAQLLGTPIGFGLGSKSAFLLQNTINIGRIEQGLAYDELSKIRDADGNKLDEMTIRTLSAVVGTVNGLLETAQLGVFAKASGIDKLGKKGLMAEIREALKDATVSSQLKRIAARQSGASLAEGTIETAQETSNVLAAYFAEKASASVSNKFRTDPDLLTPENANRLFQAFKVGAAASLVYNSPSVVIQGGYAFSEGSKTQILNNSVRKLARSVSETATAKIRPQEIEKLIAQTGIDKQAYITAEDAVILMQDKAEMMSKLGIDEAQVQRAQESGDAIAISAAKLSTSLSPAELDTILNFTRAEPDGVSQAELDSATTKNTVEQLKTLISRTSQKDIELDTELKRIHGEMLDIGVPKQQADANLALLRGHLDRIQIEGQQTAAQLAKKIRVVGPGTQVVTPEGLVLDQSAPEAEGGKQRYTSIPKEWLGADLVAWKSSAVVKLAGKRKIKGKATLPAKWMDQFDRVPTAAKALVKQLRAMTDEVFFVRGKAGNFILAPKQAIAQAKLLVPDSDAEVQKVEQQRKDLKAKEAARAKSGEIVWRLLSPSDKQRVTEEAKALGMETPEYIKEYNARIQAQPKPQSDLERANSLTPEQWEELMESDPDTAERLVIAAEQASTDPVPDFDVQDLTEELTQEYNNAADTTEQDQAVDDQPGEEGSTQADSTTDVGEGVPSGDRPVEAVIAGTETFGPQSRNPEIRAEAAKTPPTPGRRGALIVANDGYIIKVMESADVSTIPHELAHIFFIEIESLIASGQASKDMVKAMAAVKKWMGLKIDDEIGVDQHEMFADGFTKWLQEGRAPNKQLDKAFGRFRKWLTSLYRRVKNEVQLTPAVREAFERFVAVDTEAMIGQAEAGAFTLTDEEMTSLGMSKADINKARSFVNQAVNNAASNILKKRNRSRAKRLKRWRKAAKRIVLASRPHQVMVDLAKNGPLDLDQVKTLFGQDTATALRKKNPKYIKEGGRDILAVALQFGYADADVMMKALLDAETPGRAVKKLVADREARFESMFNAKEEVAINASWTAYLDQIGKFISQAANKSEPRNLKAAFVRLAQQTLGKQILKDSARPDKFIRTAQRLVREQNEAIVKQDFETALIKNRQARLQLEMARESVKHRDLKAKITRAIQKSVAVKLGKIEEKYHDAIRALAHRAGVLRKGTNPLRGELVPLDTLVQAENGNEILLSGPTFSDFLVSDDKPIPLNSLTVDQATELRDLVKYLEGKGREEAGVKRFLDGREIDEVVDELLEPLTGRNLRKEYDADSRVQTAIRWLRQKMLNHDSLAFLLLKLDNFTSAKPGGKVGPAQLLLEQNLRTALSNQLDAHIKLVNTINLAPLVQTANGPMSIDGFIQSRLKNADVVTDIPVFELLKQKGVYKWTYERVFSLLLNRGNEHNLRALTEGYGVTVDQIDKLINDVLTDDDFAAAQAIWDLNESFYPELNRIHNILYHYSIKKVEAEAFQSKSGKTYRGGYFPLSFDAEINMRTAQETEVAEAKIRYAQVYQNPVSVESFFKERAKSSGGRPVRLDGLTVATTHLRGVVDAIALDETLVAINRVFLNQQYAQEIATKFGVDFYKALRQGLNLVKNPGRPEDAISKALKYTRSYTNLYILSSLEVGIKQTFSIFNFASGYGLPATIRGVRRFVSNPRAGLSFVRDSSSMMRDRGAQVDREFARGGLRKLGSNKLSRLGVATHVIDDVVAGVIRVPDMGTSTVAWLGAYETRLHENGGDVHDARAFADTAVATTQPSSLVMDLSPIQLSQNGVTRLITFFSTFMLLGGGMLSRRGRFLMGAVQAGAISPKQFAYQMMLEFAVPPVTAALLIAHLRDDDKDIKDLLGDIAMYQFSGLTLVRDAAFFTRNVIEKGGPVPGGIFSSPGTRPLGILEDAFTSGVSLTYALFDEGTNEKTGQKKWNEALYHLVQLASYGTKIPAAQYYERYMKGYSQLEEDDTLYRQTLRRLFPSRDTERDKK